jgi:lactate dehydrogenase-like 2-hydroxyacid dehydrogenase
MKTALISALQERRIAAAGLDVFAHEPQCAAGALMDLPNACLLPHVASASVSTRNAMADLVVGQSARHGLMAARLCRRWLNAPVLTAHPADRVPVPRHMS